MCTAAKRLPPELPHLRLPPLYPLLQVAGIQSTYQEAAAATKAAHERAEALRGQLHAASGQLHSLQQQMQRVKEAGRSKLAAFGGKPVVALVAAIGRAKGQFSRPPIGPMGQHLTLEDTRWGWGGAERGREGQIEQCGALLCRGVPRGAPCAECEGQGRCASHDACTDAVAFLLLHSRFRLCCRWAHAAEVALSFQLNAFLVHSMRDAQLLRQMINTHFSGGWAGWAGGWAGAEASGAQTGHTVGSRTMKGQRQRALWGTGALVCVLPLITSHPVVAAAHLPAACLPAGGGAYKPQVYVVNFDLPQHTIPPANQPPPSVPTLYRLLSCPDKRLAAPILNNLVDQAHIGG